MYSKSSMTSTTHKQRFVLFIKFITCQVDARHGVPDNAVLRLFLTETNQTAPDNIVKVPIATTSEQQVDISIAISKHHPTINRLT